MTQGNRPHPVKLPLSLLFFGTPALLFLLLQRIVVPCLDKQGVVPLVSFFVLFLPHVLFFVGALVGYRLEGNPRNWKALSERFRLRPVRGRDWLWTAAAALGNIGLYLLVYLSAYPVLRWLHDLFPEPEAVARAYGDSTSFAGVPLEGNAWLLAVFFVGYFFNVMGEELWWRGYIFPRQELTHGNRTWVVHGLLWAGFHLFSPYNALMVLPGALLVSWIVQRQQNTTIFIIAHAAMNGIVLIRLISGVLS